MTKNNQRLNKTKKKSYNKKTIVNKRVYNYNQKNLKFGFVLLEVIEMDYSQASPGTGLLVTGAGTATILDNSSKLKCKYICGGEFWLL